MATLAVVGIFCIFMLAVFWDPPAAGNGSQYRLCL